MMPLPLIDHAIVHGIERSHAQGEIRITTTLGGGHLLLVITDTGAGLAPEQDADGIVSIRPRLAALYGTDASLVLQRRGTAATEAVLNIPHEAVNTLDPGPETGAS